MMRISGAIHVSVLLLLLTATSINGQTAAPGVNNTNATTSPVVTDPNVTAAPGTTAPTMTGAPNNNVTTSPEGIVNATTPPTDLTGNVTMEPTMNVTMGTMAPTGGGTTAGTTAPTSNATTTPLNDTDNMVVTVAPMPEENPPCPGNTSNIFCQDEVIAVDDSDETRAPSNETVAPTVDDSGLGNGPRETMAPTPFINEMTNTLCSQLDPGDVFVYVVAGDDPDGIGFLALENIPAGLELLMTDNAWTGTEFATEEGTVMLLVNSSGIPSGQQFGFGFDYGKDQEWERVQGVFNFGTSGDNLFLYCIAINGTINPLVGFSNSGNWSEPEMESYAPEESALPDELATIGSVVLPHFDNYIYEGPEAQQKADLQKSMMDPNNWKGKDEGLGDQSGASRIVLDLTSAAAAIIALAVHSL